MDKIDFSKTPNGATHYCDNGTEGRQFFKLELTESFGFGVITVWLWGKQNEWVLVSRTMQPSKVVLGLKPLHDLLRPWVPANTNNNETYAFFSALLNVAAKSEGKTLEPAPKAESDDVIAEIAEFIKQRKDRLAACSVNQVAGILNITLMAKTEPPTLEPYTTTVKGDTLHAEFKIIPSHEGQHITSCQAFKLLTELCKTKQVE